VSVLRQLYQGTNSFDLSRLWKVSLPLAAATTLIAVVLVLARGFDLGIEFQGGGMWEAPVEDLTVAEARDALGGVGLADARVQLVNDADGQTYLRVQAGAEALDRQGEVTALMAELAGTTVDGVSTTTVGPTWGDEITGQAVRAMLYFFVAVAVYLSWRLEWRMAAGALASVLHDLALTAGIYSLFGFEVTPATVIALLTILGYSLYDTVVVYDKILEYQANTARAGSMAYPDLVNAATNRVLMRSLNTTITTLIPVVSMLVVGSFLLGGATLRDFSLALFIGLLAGAYSSIFVAAPLRVVLHGRELRLTRPRRPGSSALARAGQAKRARPAAAAGAGGETGSRPSGAGPRPRKRRQA
jgi:preprotein translocase subunit SecF